jgi:hypothetical protein
MNCRRCRRAPATVHGLYCGRCYDELADLGVRLQLSVATAHRIAAAAVDVLLERHHDTIEARVAAEASLTGLVRELRGILAVRTSERAA